MISNKLLKGKSMSYKRLKYSSFSGINTDYDQYTLPVNYSTDTYNYNFSNGALKTGLGIGNIYFPKNSLHSDRDKRILDLSSYKVKATWLFRREKSKDENIFNNVYYDNILIFQTQDGDLYFTFISTTSKFTQRIDKINLSYTPTIVNYRLDSQDSIIICSPEGMWIWNLDRAGVQTPDAGALKIENVPKIKNMCVHYERLFATVEDDRNSVWFSDDLNPTNWNVSLDEAGFISFSDDWGIVNKVVSFNDYLYVFREYGIARITAYASQTEFNVTQLFVSSGKIFGNSVCVCGDKIVMLTSNGLYTFDGYNTTKVNLGIDKMLIDTINTHCVSCYSNGKYYLACNLNFNDDKKILCENNSDFYNNALLEFDLQSGNLNIMRGVDIRNLNAIADDKVNSVLACYINSDGDYNVGQVGYLGKVYDQVLPKCWHSPLSDFGYPDKFKIIKKIYVKSDYPLTVTVRADSTTKRFNLTPRNGIAEVNTIVKGKLVAIDFESENGETNISSPLVVMGLS